MPWIPPIGEEHPHPKTSSYASDIAERVVAGQLLLFCPKTAPEMIPELGPEIRNFPGGHAPRPP